MNQDQRLQELVSEFQRRTIEAYNEGGMPSASFLVKYATDGVTMSTVWSVPDLPIGGRWVREGGQAMKDDTQFIFTHIGRCALI